MFMINFAYLLILFGCYCASEESNRSFVINYENNCFMKDNQPFRYISGGMHYFRIPTIYWRDRLLKAKALGMNTIQTYIAWNVHENIQGVYNFSGEKDLLQFIKIAEEVGLLVILRPGPYIDAEWEFGGFPAWLAKNQTLKMRTSDPAYMHYVKTWFNTLFPMLKPQLYRNGGPIIAFQVENEYGNYFACDKEYLLLLKSIYDKNFGEKSVVLFTTDGYTDDYLECGTSPELYITVDFGTEITPEKAFKQQRKYQQSGPLVNSEYYTGWLDYWGRPHQRRDAKLITDQLDKILAMNASVNLYMLHGGTNFGFMNGVDWYPNTNQVLISPTSYDYDAPISEAGDTTNKYFEIRNMLKKYVDIPSDPVPQNTTKASYGRLFTLPFYTFYDFIKVVYYGFKPIKSKYPLTMEEMDLDYGFANYRTMIPSQYQNKTTILTIDYVSDRTLILIDNRLIDIIKQGGRVELNITLGQQLDIFIENEGRAAYSPKGIHYLPQKKGIDGNVRVTNDGIVLVNWLNYAINESKFSSSNSYSQSLERMRMSLLSDERVERKKVVDDVPYITTYYGFMKIDVANDSYLRLVGFKKGQAFVNGFNVGRFWQNKGPQKTLFVPKSAFKTYGTNIITILSLDKLSANPSIEFVKEPLLG